MLLRGTNLHTSVFTWLVKLQFDNFRERTKDDFVVPAPHQRIGTTILDALGGREIGVEDFEDDGIHGWQRTLIGLLHRLTPLSDPRDPYDSVAQAQRELRAIFGERLRAGAAWADPTSDEALTTLALQGLAAHRLERAEGGYQVDFSDLDDLQVREGFARYGARLELDEALAPVAIERLGVRHTPGAPGWEAAKLAWRSALALSATVRDHAVHCHFTAANAFTVATRRSLPPRHPLRLLLHPFQFRTPTINSGAMLTLLPERAIFHRLFGLEWPSLRELYARSLRSYRVETLPESLERRGVADLSPYPYGEDGLAYQEIIEELVADYLAAVDLAPRPIDDPAIASFREDLARLLPEGAAIGDLASHQSLVRLCSYFIFQATAFHEQVGGAIGDYLSRPDMVVPALREGGDPKSMWPTRNTMVQSVMLGVLTNFAVPQVTMDFSEFVPAPARPVVKRWLSRLQAHQRTVDQRNEARPTELLTFAPSRLELSVSI